MAISFSDYLKKIREHHQLTQEYIAEQIGTSRQTYSQVEKGVSELNISEATKLAGIYDITVAGLLARKMPQEPVITIEKGAEKDKITDIRISVPQKNIDKFKEVLLYILEKVGAKPNVGETVIYKLLYFIDFDYYEKYEEQLIGATYKKNHYGPTPMEFKKIVDEMIEKQEITKVENEHFQYRQKKYLPLKNSTLKELSARELAHIDEVLARLSDKTATELSEYSHRDVPWITTEDQGVIDYESVFYRTKETSVRKYDR